MLSFPAFPFCESYTFFAIICSICTFDCYAFMRETQRQGDPEHLYEEEWFYCV